MYYNVVSKNCTEIQIEFLGINAYRNSIPKCCPKNMHRNENQNLGVQRFIKNVYQNVVLKSALKVKSNF